MKRHPVFENVKKELKRQLSGDKESAIRPEHVKKMAEDSGLSEEDLISMVEGDQRMSPYMLQSVVKAMGHDDVKTLWEKMETKGDAMPPLPFVEKQSLKVFVSYSHHPTDTKCLERVRVHLAPLVKEGGLDLWDDSRIKVGENWSEAIDTALHEADACILLVSADFLASSFITQNELPPLLKKAKKDGTLIIPVIIKPCGFADDEDLAEFQALNSPNRPLLALNEMEQEAMWDKLRKVILEYIEEPNA